MVDIPGTPKPQTVAKKTTSGFAIETPAPKPFTSTAEAETKLLGGFYGSPGHPEYASPVLSPFVKEEVKPTYTQSQIARAAFERENTAVSSVADAINGTQFSNEINPDFDPWKFYEENVQGTELGQFFEDFVKITNEEDGFRLINRLNHQNENTRIINESGASGVMWSLAAGATDIVNFVPIFGTASKAFRAGKFAKGAAQTAAAGGLSVAASEGILQATQETRTAEESAINIAGGAVLGGILGGAGALLSKQKFNKLTKQLENDLHNDPKFELSDDLNLRSVGAAQVSSDLRKYYDDVVIKEAEASGKTPISFKDFEGQMSNLTDLVLEPTIMKARKVLKNIPLVGEVTEKTSKSLAAITRLNPSRRIFASQSTEAKKITEKLVNINLGLKKNVLGIESIQSAENNAKRWRAGFLEAKPEIYKLYNQYTKRIKDSGAEPELKSIGDFEETVGIAMRRKDFHPTPEVQKAAELLRVKVIDPLKKGAQEVGLLADDETLKKSIEKTALSYFPRNPKKDVVIAYEDELKDIITRKLEGVEIPKIMQKFNEDQSALKNQIDRLKLEKADAGKIKSLEEKLITARYEYEAKFAEIGSIKDYVSEVADSIILNLKGETRQGFVDGFKISKRGPLKERTLDFLRDDEFEKFLNSNAIDVLQNYSELLSKDIEIARLFDGDLTLKESLKKIDDEYTSLAKGKTPEERIALNKEKVRVKRDIEGMRDVLRGIPLAGTLGYINPDTVIAKTFRISRQLNYLQKMGAVVEASLADIAQPIAIHGMKRWGKAIGNLVFNLKGIQLSAKEAKLAGNIAERVFPGRLASMAEINDPFYKGSKFEKLLSNMSKGMSKINLMPLWNDGMKAFSSVITQQRMIEEIDNLLKGSIKQGDKEYLAFLGIGPNQAEAISTQLKQFSKKEGGLIIANTEEWTDLNAANIYRNALNLDVDRTIVTPGVGDIPLFMQTELGKVIFQFKSFTIAATQQVLIARLQQKDTAALVGLISATSLGMLTYYLRAKANGRELSNDPKKWIVEGLDRSGYLGIMMEYNNILEKLTRGSYGLNALTDSEVMSRYASRNITSTLAGPSAGLIEDAAKISGGIASGDIKESDIKAFRRMLPYQNNYFVRGAFDELEESLKSNLVSE